MSDASPYYDPAWDYLQDIRVLTARPGSGELSVTSEIIYITDPEASAELSRRLADALLELLGWARETGLLPPPGSGAVG